jgi:hypothetical protein
MVSPSKESVYRRMDETHAFRPGSVRFAFLVIMVSHSRPTPELTHAGPEDADREAELRRPSGVVCSDFVRR